jgi:hypothetical protein
MSTQQYQVVRRLATLLLLREGELGTSDIEGLPFGDDPWVADTVIGDLARQYSAVETERRLPGAVGAWERAIRLPDSEPSSSRPVVAGRR